MPGLMHRRQALKLMAAGAASLALGGRAAAQEAPKGKPNVLFIAVDDLNDWVGCLGGHPDAKTPNIDRLAKRGVTFTNAHCAAPACNPSRAALLTGIRPSTSGVYFNKDPWRDFLPDAVTLPQHFMANGYRAYGGAKIFHGGFNDPPSWYEYYSRPPEVDPPTKPLHGIPGLDNIDWGPVDATDDEMSDGQLANWAVSMLRREHETPFFLAVGFRLPHLPWYAPRKYFEMFPPDKVTLPVVNEHDLDDVPPQGVKFARPEAYHPKIVAAGKWGEGVAAYLACGTYVDAMIGRVLDALDASPYADNTIICLWGDHGWHLGEKLHWKKFTLWEESARSPLFFVAPGVAPPGGRCDRPVSFCDIYPTFVELCGLSENPALEGTSFAALLRDPQAPWDRPALTTHGRANHSLRTERWRYIRYHDGTEELYDHDVDPLEWTNLAAKPEFASVKADLARWLPATDK